MPQRKEHGGGAPEYSFDEWSEESYAVPVAQFNYGDLDALADNLREVLAKGNSAAVQEFLERYLQEWEPFIRWEARKDGFNTAIAELWGAEDCRLALAQMCFAGGLALTMGISGPQLAKQCGVSKQAFFQGVRRFEHRFGGRIVRSNARDEEARETMARRNYRRGK